MFKSLILAICLSTCIFNLSSCAKASEILLEQKVDLDLTSEQEDQINKILKEEPSFSEFQSQVLKFAAIPSNGDFRRFRKQARLRNILPNLSSSLDFGRHRSFDSISGSDYAIIRPNHGATTSTSYNYQTGQNASNIPRLTGEGGNLTYNNSDWAFYNDNSWRNNWDRALSLDLKANFSGLIYDDEVTDILSEQRRFATIRSDYVDRAFDAYHDRRKKQFSLILNPPNSKAARIMAEMELRDLTDRLDSLTGGWFSRALLRKQF